ncbi:tryptophan 7-halogenase [Luteolibacter luteus]|uniref:Tryptophan 7-halogenase n=1 Tax=Luteolibacter luteus TaxID=2728835 RepID=A0A858RJQ1_9BACT|nr:tryptophan 7-halogenase [Luteolibacter luteus]QJE96629.1 tryptophan 7-halogenase [Luteolibacter luteus]
MYPSPIHHMLVAGSGTDAFIAAATLKRAYPGINVTLLRDPGSAPEDPAGESTAPAVLQYLCNNVGLHGSDIHLHARPIWNLGFRCQWGARGTFFRSFDAPFATGMRGFRTEPGYLAADVGLDNCSLAMSLMAAGKLFPKDGNHGFKPIEHVTGLNLRPEPLNGLLLRACQTLGVSIRSGKVVGLSRNPDTLVLEDGSTLAADLYIDATGSEATLATLDGNTAWLSYEDACLCTRAATVARRRGSEPIRPYVTLEALDSGWRWRVDHDDTVGIGHAWHPDFISEDQACTDLMAKVSDSSLTPRLHHWKVGRRQQSWLGSVVAIGDASGFVEPMSSLRFSHLVLQLNWLVRVLAATDGMPGDETRRTYSRVVSEAWDESRDFHAIHYRFHAAGKSPFWDMARATAKARKHAELVDLYGSIGPSSTLESCLPSWPGFVGIDSWIAALIGMGVPFRHHPEIPEPERKAWQSLCEQRRALAKQAVHAELCIGAARRAVRPEPRVSLP